MVNDVLSFFAPGPLEVIIILAVFGLFVVIPAVLIVLLVVFLLKNNKKKQQLRSEVEKLTEELEQVRKQVTGGEKEGSSAESG